MFLIVWVILAFIIALPFSFGIGYLIGHLACRISKVGRGKTVVTIMSGFAFISSQPISLFTVWSLPGVDRLLSSLSGAAYHYMSVILLVSFALFLTIVFAFCMAQIVRRFHKRKLLQRIKSDTENQKI